MGGVVSDNGAGLIKSGYGGLTFTNTANIYSGGTVLNSGVLTASLPATAAPTPFGSGPITLNGGQLSVLDNGAGANGIITLGNNVSIGSVAAAAFINVNNNGANTGNTVQFGTLSMTPTAAQTVNVSGGNNYNAAFTGGTISGPGSTTTVTFNVAAGQSLLLGGNYAFTNGATLAGAGAGTVVLNGNNTFSSPVTLTGTNIVAAPLVNTSVAAFGTFPVTLTNGATLPLTPVMYSGSLSLLSSTGYTQGGLLARFYSYSTYPSLTSAANNAVPSGWAVGSAGFDYYDSNHPAGQSGVQYGTSMIIYSGLLYIQTAGTYTFKSSVDDEGSYTIDNQLLNSQVGNGLGATTTDYLTAGYHSIVSRTGNSGGPGNFMLEYGGPDTLASGLAMETIPASRLYYPSSPSAGLTLSTSQNAAMVNNSFVVAPGAVATINNAGTELNSMVAGMTISPSSALTINNGTNTGMLGIAGALTVNNSAGLSSPVLNVNTGILQAMGGVVDSGQGIAKAGQGSLILGYSTPGNFTGGVTVAGGFVQITDPNGLGTGTTSVLFGGPTISGTAASGSTIVPMANTTNLYPGMTVTGTGVPAGAYVVSVNSTAQTVTLSAAATASGSASLAFAANGMVDLNGQTNVTGNLVLSGSGVINTYGLIGAANGALYNSNYNPASTSSLYTVTLGSSGATISGLGNITINGSVQDGSVAGTTLTKNGPNTLLLAASNGFTGAVTVAGGLLQLGNSAALGSTASTNTITVSSGASLDLNGQNVSAYVRPLNISGTGVTGLAAPNLLGSLVNNSANGATSTYGGAITMAANASIGSSSDLASSPGGNIVLSGPISGGVTLTKVGQDTLYLTGSNNYTATPEINMGTVVFSGTGQQTAGAASIAVNAGASLVLDNSGSNVNNRIGGRGVYVNGNWTIIGNASAATTEFDSVAGSNFNFQNCGSVITLLPNAAQGLALVTSNTFTRAAGATSLFRGTGLGNTPGNDVATFSSTGGVTPVFVGQTNLSGTNQGVLPWALVDSSGTGYGMSLATYSTANSTFQALNFSNVSGVTNTLTTNANVLLNTGVATVANSGVFYINSLTLSGSNGGLVSSATISAGSTIELQSGGLLGIGSATISGPGGLWTNGNAELIVHTPNPDSGGTTALTISAPIVDSTGGMTKADGGLLTIAAQNLFTGTTTINGGTLQTAVPNAIYVPYTTAASPGNVTSGTNGQVLELNPGGTLDLAGNNESFNVFNSVAGANNLPGVGGTVMNSGAMANFRVAPNANEYFGGSITGPINFIRDGVGTLTLSYSSNYTGTTTLNGGVTTLQDYGAVTNTSEIYIRRAVLRWDDNAGVTALSTRLPSGINLWFDGGAFIFNARSGTNTVQTINDNLVFNSGNSEIDPLANAGTVQLTLSSYSVATGATVTFGGNGNLVNANDDDNVGGSARVYFTTPPAMINGIIPWATTFGYDPTLVSVTNANFATYDPSLGVKPTAGGGVQVSGAVSFAGSANVNVQPSGNITLPGGGATMNSLFFHAASTISFTNSTDTLYVQAGAILGDSNGNTARQIGLSPGFGNLTVGNPGTTGSAQFYISNASNTLTINANIVDNVPGGSAPATLVFGAADVAAGAITLAGSNSYSGATYVNGVALNLNSPGGPALMPFPAATSRSAAATTTAPIRCPWPTPRSPSSPVTRSTRRPTCSSTANPS